jgi:hypothetical protein
MFVPLKLSDKYLFIIKDYSVSKSFSAEVMAQIF